MHRDLVQNLYYCESTNLLLSRKHKTTLNESTSYVTTLSTPEVLVKTFLYIKLRNKFITADDDDET